MFSETSNDLVLFQPQENAHILINNVIENKANADLIMSFLPKYYCRFLWPECTYLFYKPTKCEFIDTNVLSLTVVVSESIKHQIGVIDIDYKPYDWSMYHPYFIICEEHPTIGGNLIEEDEMDEVNREWLNKNAISIYTDVDDSIAITIKNNIKSKDNVNSFIHCGSNFTLHGIADVLSDYIDIYLKSIIFTISTKN